MFTVIKNASLLTFGLQFGFHHVRSYTSLASVTHGKTDFTAYQQANAIYKTIQPLLYILSEVKIWEISHTPRKIIATLMAIPIPFALQILNHHIDAANHPTLKEAIVYLRDHVPHINFVVNMCVQTVFAYYFSPFYLAGSCIGVTIEILREQNILSARINAIWEKCSVALGIAQLLGLPFIMDVSPFDIVQLSVSVLIFLWEHYLEKIPPENLLEHRLDIEKARIILQHPESLHVNWEHLFQDPKFGVVATEIDIVATMEELIAKVNWTPANLHVYKRKLLEDVRFRDLFPAKREEEDISDAFAMQRFREGAQLIANEIANGQISKGNSFVRYDVNQGMLKSVLRHLNETDDFLDDLFKLSLEGGDYCATEKVEVIEEILERRVLNGERVPLKLKFLYQLNAMRRRWFESAYARAAAYSYNLPKGIFDFSDIHFRNIALFYFDKCLKLIPKH